MKELTNLPARPAEPPPSPFGVGDLYYIFFRNKWKILLIFLLGLAGAVGFYFAQPPVYRSASRVFVKYVLESSTIPMPGPSAERAKSPDMRGETIMTTEMETLTSFDLLVKVADAVGPDKILARAGGGTNVMQAAGMILKGLNVAVPENSSVIHLRFQHPDPAVVRPVLSQLVASYLKKHVEIHRPGGLMDEFFQRKADEFRLKLSLTEDQLKKLKTDSDILSIDDNKRASIGSRERIEQDLFSAEAELAEQRAMLDAWKQLRPGTPLVAVGEAGVPSEVSDRYRTLSAELDFFQSRLKDLQFRFKDEHPQVRRVIEEITRLGSEKRPLEQQYTNLVTFAPPPARLASAGEVDLTTQVLRVSALQERIKVLTNQLAKVRSESGRLIDTEPELTKLQRQLASEEASYKFYSSGLEKSRVDEALGGDKVTNIDVLQTPTPPARDTSGLMKPVAMLLAFGLFGGFALAFVLERFLNQKLRRVVDLERLFQSPVFVAVPDFSWKRTPTSKLIANGVSPAEEPVPTNGAINGVGPVNGEQALVTRTAGPDAAAPWDSRHILRSYYEGLRDRLITYFEVRNLTHKPKLVAVTSCKSGAGVTTMAAGLAATLSETGDGNVLLVDMNLEQGAAHQFYQGRPGCALADALENSTRDSAQVQENLYLVSAHETRNEKLPRALPKRFAHLIPRMKASDYDYIIFDMPPISQTSVTPRLAGLMDMVLVVVESETTGQETVRRAHALLHESRATVATVLNKHRSYIPERFNQEF